MRSFWVSIVVYNPPTCVFDLVTEVCWQQGLTSQSLRNQRTNVLHGHRKESKTSHVRLVLTMMTNTKPVNLTQFTPLRPIFEWTIAYFNEQNGFENQAFCDHRQSKFAKGKGAVRISQMIFASFKTSALNTSCSPKKNLDYHIPRILKNQIYFPSHILFFPFFFFLFPFSNFNSFLSLVKISQ